MANTKDITIGAVKLDTLVKQVEAEVALLVKNDEDATAAALAKARPGEETEGSADSNPPASASDPKGDNTSTASTSPDSDSPAGDDGGSASASASPDASAGGPPAGADDGSAPPDASASPDGSAPQDPAADQGPLDPQQLAAEYAQMPLEDLKAHYYAIKEVLFQATSAAGGDGSASAAPADASASPAAPPAPGLDASAPAIKAEIGMKDNPKANGENPLHKAEPTRDEIRALLRDRIVEDGAKLSKSDREAIIGFDLGKVGVEKIAHLLKTETPVATPAAAPAATAKVEEGGLSKAEADSLRAELAKTNSAVATLVKAVKVAVETPLRKSVQFSADLKKAEDAKPATVNASAMKVEEVKAALHEKIAEMGGKLSKSDREAIIAFDLGKVSVDKVAHLLK